LRISKSPTGPGLPQNKLMILHIQNNLMVEDVQDHFSECFPWLKIEFYTKPYRSKKSTNKKYLVGPKTSISDITLDHKVGTLAIKSSDTPGHVEGFLKSFFGLNAKIFRRENNRWVQTITSDKYTLQHQKEFSGHADNYQLYS
jgi:hypothetical protein